MPEMRALNWLWHMTPRKEGELILNILLFRRSNMNKLSDLRDTAWPGFSHPSVAIRVLPERLGLLALLGKICANPIIVMAIPTVISIISLYLQMMS
jgi:hypothetical protein